MAAHADRIWHKGRNEAQRANPGAVIWAIYSHPSLSVWEGGSSVNSSAVSSPSAGPGPREEAERAADIRHGGRPRRESQLPGKPGKEPVREVPANKNAVSASRWDLS